MRYLKTIASLALTVPTVASAGSIGLQNDSVSDQYPSFMTLAAPISIHSARTTIPVISNGIEDASANDFQTDLVADRDAWNPIPLPASIGTQPNGRGVRSYQRPVDLFNEMNDLLPSGMPAAGSNNGLDFIPTPGSLALLSMGGIGLVAKRGN